MTARPAFQAVTAAVLLAAANVLAGGTAHAETADAQALDRSIEQLRAEVLSLNVEATQVEDDLLYPPATRTDFYLGVDISPLLIEQVILTIDDRPAITYRLSEREATALLTTGGLQRVARTNLAGGTHRVKVELRGTFAVRGEEKPPFEGVYEARFERDLLGGEVELNLTRPPRSSKPTLVLRSLKASQP